VKNKRILAYCFKDSLYSVTPDDAMRLTHINIAFGLIGKDGLLDTSMIDEIIGYKEVIREWNPDIKFVLSVGGWGAGGFSNMAKSEAGREAFAASCAAYAEKMRLDGIDIDWEYPCSDLAGIDYAPEDKENFTLLMEALRRRLGENRIVSIAAGAGDYFVRDTEMDKVSKVCDYVQLMTYDMRSGFSYEAGHHAALYPSAGDTSGNSAHETVERFYKAGVPLEKIVLGAAFYSRMWKGVPDINLGRLQKAETVGNYGADYSLLVSDFINRNGFVKHWDEDAKAPFLFNGSEFISYEDPDSIKEKCLYLKNRGLCGIMYWDHGGDRTHTLLKTMSDCLK